MGVPKFFRWLSERYPLINQRYYAPSPDYEETVNKKEQKKEKRKSNNSNNLSLLSDPTDVLQSATLAPEVDRLYIDMNGIIHGCSHNNNEDDSSVTEITEEQIFQNITYYLDRVVGDIVRPKELVYMAIDGVAPRAKLNQQRSRRYRTSTGLEIEQTVYEAHLSSLAQQQRQADDMEQAELEIQQSTGHLYSNDNDNDLFQDGYEEDVGPLPHKITQTKQKKKASTTATSTSSHPSTARTESSSDKNILTEVEPGRFAGKFETHLGGAEDGDGGDTSGASSGAVDKTKFHSNEITPGTPFFQRCIDHLEQYIRDRLANDPKWKDLTIIFSGPNVEGEGEHKIMDFMRHQKQKADYDPNLRHCIMGQDGDLIMLGLVTHEPNLVLFREQVIFKAERRRNVESLGLDGYIHNPNFEFLHMNVLRDYLSFDFETSNVVANSPFDLERTIDDFVFMTFFVGNDFLPSIPALDIADEAFDLLWYTYREQREKWHEDYLETGVAPYLTHAGNIVSGKRLESFLTEVGSFESPYYDNKKENAEDINRRIRKSDRKFGTETLPDDDVMQSKEEADRERFREMMIQRQKDLQQANMNASDSFAPVLSSPEPIEFEPSHHKEDERLEPGLPARLGNLLQKSFTPQKDGKEKDEFSAMAMVDDQDLKGRYYFDKFQFTPFDKEKHQALRRAYIEGLVWNLKYYYEGVASWDWFYPYHYGPMLSDLKNIDEMLEEISFEGRLGEPLQPFEQLLSCMPPSQAHMLPEPYQWLMSNPSSPIAEYYPKTFTVDMNGKRWPWEAVVLLPFINTQNLLKYSRRVPDDLLSADEVKRNKLGHAIVMSHDSVKGSASMTDKDAVRIDPFEHSEWNVSSDDRIAFQPEVKPETIVPLPGLPTLSSAPIRSLWRRSLGINVFGLKSRYKTACLEHSAAMPTLPPLEALGRSLIGSTIWINYPHLTEAFVTEVSNESHVMRGKDGKLKRWSKKEAMKWSSQKEQVIRGFARGQGFCGTGGLILNEHQETLLSVRPFQGLRTMSDGTTVKTFSKFEVEIPIVATLWAPRLADHRLSNVPALMEKDPYKYADAPQTLISGIGQKQKTKAMAVTKAKSALNIEAKKQEDLTVKGDITEGSSDLSIPEEEAVSGETTHFSSPYDDFSPILPAYSKAKSSSKSLNGSPKNESKSRSKSSNKSLNGSPKNESKSRSKSSSKSLNGSPKNESKSRSKSKRRKAESNVDDILPLTPSHDEAWLPLDQGVPLKKMEIGASELSEDPSDSVSDDMKLVRATNSKWWEQPSRNSEPSSQRSFTTLSKGLNNPLTRFSSNHANARGLQSKTASRALSTGGPRGRVLVAAGVAAALLFGSGSHALPDKSKKRLASTCIKSAESTLLSGIVGLSGGAQDPVFGVNGYPESYTNEDHIRSPPALEFAHGTTTLSFVFQGGAIVAVDSRASLGNFVGSKTVQKVLPINSHILGTMAGGAADCSYLMRKLMAEAQLLELSTGRRMSTSRVSRILSNLLYSNRGAGLSVGTMILGYDDDDSQSNPPKIFYVDDTGVRIPGLMFSAGSGSTFALAILDTERRYDMTEEEAIALGIKAIRHASFRDAFSGGFINVYLITRDGWRKVFTEDVAVTAEKIQQEQNDS